MPDRDDWWDELREEPAEPDGATDLREPWPHAGGADGGQPWLVSATDLLVSWQPDPVAGQQGPAAWDRYFGEPEPPAARPAGEAATEAADDAWDTDAADATVELLYRFLHAVERGDVAAAVGCTAEDFHHLEGDREVDRDGLRLRLEALADSWQPGETRVSLTEVPQPVFHPDGVLIRVTVQVDYRRRVDERLVTELLPRIVVFAAGSDGQWRIAALSPNS
jgi:hypothetical protein